MGNVGRFEIQSPIFSGAVETFSARDPENGNTVLLHLLPADGAGETPEQQFLKLAPGCPGKVLHSGIDAASQRSFVVTDYPKDRKAVLLWIKQLTLLPAKPAAPPPAAAKPPAAAAATRMFDPSAVFGGAGPAAPAAAAPKPGEGATRMFDPSAIFGGAAPASPKQASVPPATPAADGGATRMFDPAAIFGPPAVSAAEPAPKPAEAPAKTPPPKTPPPFEKRTTPALDANAIFGLAKASAASSTPAPQESSAPSKPAGEFTRRFELPTQFRSAPTRVQRAPEEFPTVKTPELSRGEWESPTPERPGVVTLMFEEYGRRLDAATGKETAKDKPESGPAAPPSSPPSSGGETRILSGFNLAAALGEVAPPPTQPGAQAGGATSAAPVESSPSTEARKTERLDAVHPEENKK